MRRETSGVPESYGVLEGKPQGGRRAVGIVVSRFNGAVTSKLLDGTRRARPRGRRA